MTKDQTNATSIGTLTRGEMRHGERNQRNLRLAQNVAKKVFEDPTSFPENMVILEIESGVVDSLFTPERMEIIRTLRLDGPVFSGEELGARVGREAQDMVLDLLDLEMVGLIEIEEIGHRARIRAPECPVIIV